MNIIKKNLKRILVAICVVILMPLQYVNATESFDVDECFDIATGVLREYYEEVDLGKTAQLNKSIFLDINMYDYVINKINTKTYISNKANLLKENYELKFNLLSVTQEDECCKLTIQAEAVYKYQDVDEQSGFGKVSEITFVLSDNEYRIADWYDPYDDYDITIREDGTVGIFDKSIIEKQLKYLGSVEDYFENEYGKIQSPAKITPSITTNRKTVYSLNKSAIVAWARNNIISSPSSGGANVPYYDFSQISGNYDCTNFVSHALLSGGAIPYVTTEGVSPRATGWYYENLNDRSSSWSGVSNLYNFITSNTIKGPTGVGITYTTHIAPSGTSPIASAPYELGDILQFHNGSVWRHSAVITSVYQVSGATYGALVTGRTGNGSYNNNDKAESIYPGYSKRVIKLSGYYK